MNNLSLRFVTCFARAGRLCAILRSKFFRFVILIHKIAFSMFCNSVSQYTVQDNHKNANVILEYYVHIEFEEVLLDNLYIGKLQVNCNLIVRSKFWYFATCHNWCLKCMEDRGELDTFNAILRIWTLTFRHNWRIKEPQRTGRDGTPRGEFSYLPGRVGTLEKMKWNVQIEDFAFDIIGCIFKPHDVLRIFQLLIDPVTGQWPIASKLEDMHPRSVVKKPNLTAHKSKSSWLYGLVWLG